MSNIPDIKRELQCAELDWIDEGDSENADLARSALNRIEKLERALDVMRTASISVLMAMDRYNEVNGTAIGGAAFFGLGRAVNHANETLSPD